MTDRRAHIRLLDCELVIVHWKDGDRDLQQLGNAEDVSLGGMRVHVDHPIPVGSAVKISYESLFSDMLTGTVKHRVEGPEGVSLGIGFETENLDSRLISCPELFAEVA